MCLRTYSYFVHKYHSRSPADGPADAMVVSYILIVLIGHVLLFSCLTNFFRELFLFTVQLLLLIVQFTCAVARIKR
jgi:hypothetical protein